MTWATVLKSSLSKGLADMGLAPDKGTMGACPSRHMSRHHKVSAASEAVTLPGSGKYHHYFERGVCIHSLGTGT